RHTRFDCDWSSDVCSSDLGSRQEIAQAARALAEKVAAGRIAPDDITPATLANHLDTAGIPDPDLIIRTSGERRLSNFLMWQAARSEERRVGKEGTRRERRH